MGQAQGEKPQISFHFHNPNTPEETIRHLSAVMAAAVAQARLVPPRQDGEKQNL